MARAGMWTLQLFVKKSQFCQLLYPHSHQKTNSIVIRARNIPSLHQCGWFWEDLTPCYWNIVAAALFWRSRRMGTWIWLPTSQEDLDQSHVVLRMSTKIRCIYREFSWPSCWFTAWQLLHSRRSRCITFIITCSRLVSSQEHNGSFTAIRYWHNCQHQEAISKTASAVCDRPNRKKSYDETLRFRFTSSYAKYLRDNKPVRVSHHSKMLEENRIDGRWSRSNRALVDGIVSIKIGSFEIFFDVRNLS